MDEGDGFPLLLVHGSPTTSALWRHQIPVLSKRFRIIAPDVLGFGRSVAQDEGVSFAQQADALRALLEHLGIDLYSFVGHDWGGPVSCACAAQRPEEIHQWVLVNTTFRPSYRPPWYWKPFTAPLPRPFRPLNPGCGSAYPRDLKVSDVREAIVDDILQALDKHGMTEDTQETCSPSSTRSKVKSFRSRTHGFRAHQTSRVDETLASLHARSGVSSPSDVV